MDVGQMLEDRCAELVVAARELREAVTVYRRASAVGPLAEAIQMATTVLLQVSQIAGVIGARAAQAEAESAMEQIKRLGLPPRTVQ